MSTNTNCEFRSEEFRAAVPHGVLACFYIKPNFPGRWVGGRKTFQIQISIKQKHVFLSNQTFSEGGWRIQDKAKILKQNANRQI